MADETPDTHEGNGLSRRDLLAKAGAIGAGTYLLLHAIGAR